MTRRRRLDPDDVRAIGSATNTKSTKDDHRSVPGRARPDRLLVGFFGFALLHFGLLVLAVQVSFATEYDSSGSPPQGILRVPYQGSTYAVEVLCWPGETAIRLLSIPSDAVILRIIIAAGNSLLFGLVISLFVMLCRWSSHDRFVALEGREHVV